MENDTVRAAGRRTLPGVGGAGVRPAVPAGWRLAARSGDRRHPLVALAIVLPLAVLLAVFFGGWDAVLTQASSVAGMLGR